MRAPSAAVLVLVALLAGCLAEGHCPPSYDDLEWTQPGLYGSISGAEPARLAWTPGNGALPWNGTMAVPGQRLLTVEREVPRPVEERRGIFVVDAPHLLRIGVERDGWLTALVDGNLSEAALRSSFDAVLGNVTRSGFDAEAAWIAFAASRTDTGSASVFPIDDNMTRYETRPHWHHGLSLAGHLDFEGLATRISLPAASWGSVGQLQATAGGWSFTYSLPTWTIEDEAGVLRIDATDHAQASTHDANSRAELEASARSLLTLLGQDAVLDDATHSESVC